MPLRLLDANVPEVSFMKIFHCSLPDFYLPIPEGICISVVCRSVLYVGLKAAARLVVWQ